MPSVSDFYLDPKSGQTITEFSDGSTVKGTAAVNFGSGGEPYVLNEAGQEVALNVELDVSSQWADPTLTDRVRGGYSTDGVHASTVSAPLMAAAVAARARTWVAV